jgi:hypothetical protein
MAKTIDEIAHLGGVVAPKVTPGEDPRKDQRQIVTWHHKAVRAQLKQLASEQETTIQKLVAEALNMLFEKHGKGPIA